MNQSDFYSALRALLVEFLWIWNLLLHERISKLNLSDIFDFAQLKETQELPIYIYIYTYIYIYIKKEN